LPIIEIKLNRNILKINMSKTKIIDDQRGSADHENCQPHFFYKKYQ